LAKTLSESGRKLHVAEVVRHGEQLLVPDGMSIAQAIELLKRRMEYDNQVASFIETFDAFPWDGAYALWKVLGEKYGWASGLPTPGFFGSTPPAMITIDAGPDQQVSVPWGRIAIPGVEGYLELGIDMKQNRMVFQITVNTKRKFEPDIRELCRLVREYLRGHSIYKGKAIKMRFRNDRGEVLEMPEPKFLATEGLGPADLIFSDSVHEAVETNLFTPITRRLDCSAAAIPFKRGVLLAGDFGVGKTLAARIAAKLCVEFSVSYIYCVRADEFAQAVEFAIQYQPAVVFCEDIDRALAGERSVSMDELLNVVDGVDSKRSEVMVVLTTNAVEEINPAMLRPGRLDAVIEVTKPDAKATERLLRHYGRGVIGEDVNLSSISDLLKDNIPAVIAEVVKRSKLAALKRTPFGTSTITVDEAALTEASFTMETQLRLLKGKRAVDIHPADPLIEHLGKLMDSKLTNGLSGLVNKELRAVLKSAGFDFNK
jgi:transitional endoplasmic reticulum ATPase